MVQLEPDKVSAEYVYDASANKVRVYLDKATAEKATAVTMESLVKEGEVDVFPFENGLILRKDVYSSSHAPRLVD